MADENENLEEPSMDNILSSIRKILSEDEKVTETIEKSPSGPDKPVAAEAAAVQPKQETSAVTEMEMPQEELDNEVSQSARELTENPLNVELDAAELDADSLDQPQYSDSTDGGGILELTQQMIAQPPPNIGAGESILSSGASANSTDALQELAKALLNKRDIAIGNKDLTLEGLVREILRPLLREWLDQNLPYLIERLVKKEIDHMVNRAERLDL